MDKNNLKDAYDIGENMAVFSGEGRSYTIINKDLEIIVPFQPIDDVRKMLKKYEK